MLLAALLVGSGSTSASAAEPLRLGWLGQAVDLGPTLATLLPPPSNEGLEGARLGISDNRTTGKFLQQDFVLEERNLPEAASDDDIAAAVRQLRQAGVSFVVSGLPAESLLKAVAADQAQRGEAPPLWFFNSAASDDRLRGAECRRTVRHSLPSRAMLGDAVGQFLMARGWSKWLIVQGPTADDAAFAAAFERSAQRFGARVVARKVWTAQADLRRSAQTELVAFTQLRDYDVVLVADERGDFGDYLPFNTFLPRPVVGTQGLMPVAWHWAIETWGAGQLQSRFQAQAHRPMTARDWAAWVAVRVIGEAATRQRSLDPQKLRAAVEAPDFSVAGFKGRPLSFRPWDGQLRQPIPLAWERALVTLAPFEGYLHPENDLDTLGMDRPETACRF